MGKAYNIIDKLDNSKSTVKIDADHEFKINTHMAAGLKINDIAKNEEINDYERINQIIQVGLGKEAYEYIDSLQLNIPSYTPIVNAIVAALNGLEIEEIEEADKKEEENKKK